MATHLTDSEIEKIVELLDGWRDDLSWELLIQACDRAINRRPSRQTLARAYRIALAFGIAKDRVKIRKVEGGPSVPPSIRVALQRIERLTAENARLEIENTRLLEQFVTWQYNAHTAGIGREQLNRPMPCVNLGRTDS